MNELLDENVCTDPTESLTVEIPCALVDRARRFAKERDETLSGVMIEALDHFLRTVQ